MEQRNGENIANDQTGETPKYNSHRGKLMLRGYPVTSRLIRCIFCRYLLQVSSRTQNHRIGRQR